ncbi:S-adenosyl-L-methionine-dependent methyltransferase [Phellopilus nigrolimitatus]|nr:S-adenosyl-L-methionine-dependent methyltransferase [Phellopilus nigrolimitatus]
MDVDDTHSTVSGSTPSGSSTMLSSMDGSPAPSLYSYRSDRDGHTMLREIAGRTLNTTNDLYLLPADEGEHVRLDKQHLVSLLSIGGLYIAVQEVRDALAPAVGRQRTILDLGCGGGNWAMGMAQEFPHAQVVGVDLAPTTVRPPPFNCRLPWVLEHYYNSFDVVHARCTANGVKDFERFVHEAAKCVRPGGVLLFMEGNLEIQNEQMTGQEAAFGDAAPGQSWLARSTFEAYNLMKARGSYVDAGMMLERWMLSCRDLTDVQSREIWTPVGPWKTGSTLEETQRLEMVGQLMRQNMKEYVRSCKPMFVATGYPPALIERFIEGTDKELDELSLRMYVKWHYAWSRRIVGPNHPFPAIDMSGAGNTITVDEYVAQTRNAH